MTAQFLLQDGTQIQAENYGADVTKSGEVVFATGMMGYPESLTDPSYSGQILILTYPLVGNYGVPDKQFWESNNLMVAGLIVSDYIDTPSHFQSTRTLAQWFRDENIPLLQIKDTRLLTQKIREQGTMLGKIIPQGKPDVPFFDPNNENLVSDVSTKQVLAQHPQKKSGRIKTLLLIDCGAKRNIQKSLLERGIRVITVPWDFNPFTPEGKKALEAIIPDTLFDGIVISNGPGDPKKADKTIATIQEALKRKIPLLGICLGHQLLSLAAGGDTQKLKYGHRSQNQPCILLGSNRCYITTQNHGFSVTKIPSGFEAWFTNANDGSNEGIKHKSLPVMSVQFHPEATPGPIDCDWIFDYFLEQMEKKTV